MFDKKNYVLNCDVCDTRKMKEEDYSTYEKMIINADVVVVSETSKSILNRLPVTINQDCTIEIADDVDTELMTINGSYEITPTANIPEHTLLIVNGSLNIQLGTEEVLDRYEKIHVNGTVKYPKSLEGCLGKLSVNGSVSIYPDDCVILDKDFVLDKYFPLRAKEGRRYYAEQKVIIQDKSVDLAKLVQKKVQFITKQLIVPEEMIEDCIELFDETVDFIVIPAGMTLHYGNAVLNEQLVEKAGNNIYVYGNLKVAEDCDIETLAQSVKKVFVKNKVILKKSQEEHLRKLDIEYSQMEYTWEGRLIENKPSAKIDKALLESSPNKVLVRNAATIKIVADASPELIMDRLMIENCAKVSCNEEQESAVATIAKNVARIGDDEGEKMPGIVDGVKELLATKIINADKYIM